VPGFLLLHVLATNARAARRWPKHDPVMADDLETLTRNNWIAVQRVRRPPVPELDKLAVLADLEVIYRQ